MLETLGNPPAIVEVANIIGPQRVRGLVLNPHVRLATGAGVRFRVGHAALTVAEHIRNVMERDVLVLIDNIFRFVQAGAEISALLGRIPSRVGYQPTLGSELAELEERICNTATGSITSIQAVYVPADDFTDPAATPPSRICPPPSCYRASGRRRVFTRPSTRWSPAPRCSRLGLSASGITASRARLPRWS